jgi:hypothetical protein
MCFHTFSAYFCTQNFGKHVCMKRHDFSYKGRYACRSHHPRRPGGLGWSTLESWTRTSVVAHTRRYWLALRWADSPSKETYQILKQVFSTRGPHTFSVILCHHVWWQRVMWIQKVRFVNVISIISSRPTYRCEYLYSVMKNVWSRTHITDKHLGRCMRIATRETKHDIERLMK